MAAAPIDPAVPIAINGVIVAALAAAEPIAINGIAATCAIEFLFVPLSRQ
jgi:hypothetical protein